MPYRLFQHLFNVFSASASFKRWDFLSQKANAIPPFTFLKVLRNKKGQPFCLPVLTPSVFAATSFYILFTYFIFNTFSSCLLGLLHLKLQKCFGMNEIILTFCLRCHIEKIGFALAEGHRRPPRAKWTIFKSSYSRSQGNSKGPALFWGKWL